MRMLSTSNSNFKKWLAKIYFRQVDIESNVEKSVRSIVERVRKKGDDALWHFSQKYDRFKLSSKNIEVKKREIKSSPSKLEESQKKAIMLAAERIRKFHEKQIPMKTIKWKEGRSYLKKIFSPIEKVGVYVPGGKASYPSTVLMNVIPAKVAGVKEIVMVTPPSHNGKINPAVLFAAEVAGVDRIFRVGGAHSIAALAFGTQSIGRVDKIVGPGNIFVATAKKVLSGLVGTDLFAGPSELVVIADDKVNPAFVAADLLSQAEHDELAFTAVLSPFRHILYFVKNELVEQLQKLPTKEIASLSIANNCFFIQTKNIEETVDVVNKIAPEHVEVMCKNAGEIAEKIKNAGTIFAGEWTPEPIGDYVAGSNHVLPTGGSARFSSGLSVLDFLKSTNVVFFTKRKLKKLYLSAAEIAEMENLYAHSSSLKIRFEKLPDNKE